MFFVRWIPFPEEHEAVILDIAFPERYESKIFIVCYRTVLLCSDLVCLFLTF